MYKNKSIIGVIPARGGSKGIPKKNIKPLAGKPLISWTIEEAKKSKYLDRLILTSDNEEIIKVAKKYGCDVPFVRPSALAGDNTSGIDPIIHALGEINDTFDYVLVLQPTSPLRNVIDIDTCIEKIIDNNDNSLVSIYETDKSPYWMFILNEGNQLKKLIDEQIPSRRQDTPDSYSLNGAIYLADTRWFLDRKSFLNQETKGYIMPKERSFDIDTELDFQICEFLILKNGFRSSC
jgi:CMP-N,N'-diacetyllegionaminic acid synthase